MDRGARRGRPGAVLVEAQRAEVGSEVVVGQHETAATTTKRGCVENARADRLVLGVVAGGIEPDHGSARLDDADAVSPAGRATTAAAVFVLGGVHARPELAEGRAVVQ